MSTAEAPRRKIKEMEVMVAETLVETPDTTTLVLFTGNDHLEYKAGNFLTIDPHQFEALERFVAFLEDLKGKKEPPRAYSLTSAPHEKHLAITVKEDITLGGLLNYVDGENRDTGDKLYNIMPLNAKLSLTQKSGRWTNALEAQFVSEKDEVSQVRNEIKTDGYSLFNLRSSYAWKQVRLDVGVENLFDEDYDLPLGGAYVGQGTTMSISAVPWGIAVPGPGRSIYAGLNVKF